MYIYFVSNRVFFGRIRLFFFFMFCFVFFFPLFFFPLKDVIIMLLGETELLVGFFHKNNFSISSVINSLWGKFCLERRDQVFVFRGVNSGKQIMVCIISAYFRFMKFCRQAGWKGSSKQNNCDKQTQWSWYTWQGHLLSSIQGCCYGEVEDK